MKLTDSGFGGLQIHTCYTFALLIKIKFLQKLPVLGKYHNYIVENKKQFFFEIITLITHFQNWCVILDRKRAMRIEMCHFWHIFSIHIALAKETQPF